jgi:hypothetical protein
VCQKFLIFIGVVVEQIRSSVFYLQYANNCALSQIKNEEYIDSKKNKKMIDSTRSNRYIMR